MSYFIKCIYGPHGRKYKYPKKQDNMVGFFKDRGKQWQEFQRCDGFLLFERGLGEHGEKGVGADTIYAYGKIDGNQVGVGKGKGRSGKEYFVTKVVIEKIVDPRCGISLPELNEYLARRSHQPPCLKGGIYPISEEQFNALCSKLDLISEKLNFNKSLKILIIGTLGKGIKKELSEICIKIGFDYDLIENVDFDLAHLNLKKLKAYRGLIVGPHDHAAGEEQNFISELTNNPNKYPSYETLNHRRQISKSALEHGLVRLAEKIWKH